jgi:hypothetical protein
VIAGRTAVVAIGLLVAATALAVVIASTLGQPAAQTETGLVIAVDSSGLTDVRGFTIRTNDGRTVVFRLGVLENGAAFPPGHLLEHAATGVKVVVTYRRENGELVAIRLEDAPAGTTGSSSPAVASPT